MSSIFHPYDHLLFPFLLDKIESYYKVKFKFGEEKNEVDKCGKVVVCFYPLASSTAYPMILIVFDEYYYG